MIKPQNNTATILAWIVAFLLTMYIAIVLAGQWENGISIFEYMDRISGINSLQSIRFNDYTLKFVLVFAAIYGVGVSAYYDYIQRRRNNEEHGSAAWGSHRQVNKAFSQNKKTDILLTQHVSLGLDTYKHRRNLNVLVVGGSGSGKSRFYVRPNIMQMNTSFVVCDPKAELLKSTGQMLKDNGYEIKVINLVNFAESDSYNPFKYIRTDIDVIKLINNLISNTTPKNARENDPFWVKSETALLQALMFYLVYEAPEFEQNFSTIISMLEYAGASEDDEDYKSPLDVLFAKLDHDKPNHIAVKQYKVYKQAAGKTAKSILVSCAVRLAAFNLRQVKNITSRDDIDIPSLAEKKTAIFAVTPDNDTSFNFLVGLLYTQVFQEMYYQADYTYQGTLPIPLHVIMDEFANVALPDDFDKILSTMRSRGISASIILQNLSQLKGIFKSTQHAWETIVGNTDTFLYLGGNEQSTHKYVSELLGKSTIRFNTHNKTKGRMGSYTINGQLSGRDLLAPDEVRLLDNDYAILFIRGAKPVMDKKYDLLSHPNISQTTEGNAKPYIHISRVNTENITDGIDLNRAEDYIILDD